MTDDEEIAYLDLNDERQVVAKSNTFYAHLELYKDNVSISRMTFNDDETTFGYFAEDESISIGHRFDKYGIKELGVLLQSKNLRKSLLYENGVLTATTADGSNEVSQKIAINNNKELAECLTINYPEVHQNIKNARKLLGDKLFDSILNKAFHSYHNNDFEVLFGLKKDDFTKVYKLQKDS